MTDSFDPNPRARKGGNRPPRLFKRHCPECGERFETPTHDRLFCTDEHKAAFHNRSSKIGRSLVPLAMAWRAARNAKGNSPEARALRKSGARAFTEMCLLLDRAVTDDREEARMPKLDYVRHRHQMEGTLQREELPAFHVAEDERKARLAAREAKAAAKAAEQPATPVA